MSDVMNSENPLEAGQPAAFLRWTHGNIMHVAKCPCCGTDGGNGRIYVRRDDNFSFPDAWTFRTCVQCRSMFLENRPDPASLPMAYRNYYTHALADADGRPSEGWLRSLENGYLNARFGMQRMPAWSGGHFLFKCFPPVSFLLDIHGRHVPRHLCGSGAKLLDIGCGNGDFLVIAREMGLDASGCEPDGQAAALCARRGLTVIHGDVDDVLDSGFDIVTMNHVIEHVEDPRVLLGKAYALLAPGGILWIGLPNPEAPGLRVFSKGWKGFHPPFHLVIPSQDILKSWLVEAGFHDVRNVRRGMQSPGLWTESTRIYRREGGWMPEVLLSLAKMVCDIGASIFPSWSEETIMIATKR